VQCSAVQCSTLPECRLDHNTVLEELVEVEVISDLCTWPVFCSRPMNQEKMKNIADVVESLGNNVDTEQSKIDLQQWRKGININSPLTTPNIYF
jgi:hypothetical protein